MGTIKSNGLDVKYGRALIAGVKLNKMCLIKLSLQIKCRMWLDVTYKRIIHARLLTYICYDKHFSPGCVYPGRTGIEVYSQIV